MSESKSDSQSAERPKEMKVYGWGACWQLWKSRPQDVIRLYLTQNRLQELSEVLDWCVNHKLAYHVVSKEELNKIASALHHEGVCVLARKPPEVSFTDVLKELKDKGESKLRTPLIRTRASRAKQCVLFLDAVQNPQNIGAILRVAAHFGISYILGDEANLPGLSPSACRVAEGAAEWVKLVSVRDPMGAIQKLKECGFACLTTSSHHGKSIHHYGFPARSLIFLGNEVKGIDPKYFELSDQTLQIPGTGAVESLNVAMAAGLVLSEYWRQTNPT